MNADVMAYAREKGWRISLPAVSGGTCPRCGSGEVTQPGQIAVPPTLWRCLHCGLAGERRRFDRVGDR